MSITEPTTMLTDYTLALFTLVLSGRLFQANAADRQVAVQLWNFALIATAAAALRGGTSHGFALLLTPFMQAAIWKATIYAVGFASFFMLTGTLVANTVNPLRRWLLALTVLKLLLYGIWMVGHSEFKYVIWDYVPAMVLVLILELQAYVSRRDAAAGWIVAGVLVSFLAAGVQLSGWAPHPHFNHNDLYHVIQMGAIYLLYRGVGRLRDLSPVATAPAA